MFHVKRRVPRLNVLFHVKQPEFHWSSYMNQEILLSDTKIPENHLKNILDIDPTE